MNYMKSVPSCLYDFSADLIHKSRTLLCQRLHFINYIISQYCQSVSFSQCSSKMVLNCLIVFSGICFYRTEESPFVFGAICTCSTG